MNPSWRTEGRTTRNQRKIFGEGGGKGVNPSTLVSRGLVHKEGGKFLGTIQTPTFLEGEGRP